MNSPTSFSDAPSPRRTQPPRQRGSTKETPAYWETGSRSESLRRFRPIARSGNVTEFAAMNTVPGLRRDISNFYTQSTDFVAYLIENYGRFNRQAPIRTQCRRGHRRSHASRLRRTLGSNRKPVGVDEWGLSSPHLHRVETEVDIQKTFRQPSPACRLSKPAP